MKATRKTPQPPPDEITLTMSAAEAHILQAVIGAIGHAEYRLLRRASMNPRALPVDPNVGREPLSNLYKALESVGIQTWQ